VADSRRRRGAVGVVVKPEPPAAVEPDFAAHSTVDDVKPHNCLGRLVHPCGRTGLKWKHLLVK